MKKRFITLLAGLLTILSMGFGLAQFSDVPAGHWAKEAVEALAARGVLVGFPDGTFRGNEPITRYQAALIIYRLLQQIEEELKAKGTSPTLEALSPEDLGALKNAIQEMAADLAALGIRVSALEKGTATRDDIARLEASIEELGAQLALEPGMDRAALQDLLDRAKAASIAADTALAQAQQLAERLEALAQDVEGVKGDLAALSAQVEANAQTVQALNELAVLLNQDIFSLQGRLTALERGLAELRSVDFERFAAKEDVAAVQEFATALRSQLTALSEKVSKLEGRLDELSKVQYSVKGSFSAAYGEAANAGGDFDIDRLFPGNWLSSGPGPQDHGGRPYRNRPAQQRGDFDQDFSRGSASLSFGVKVAQPGTSGVNVSEASVDLRAVAFPDVAVSLDGASMRGNVDGQPFSFVYSSSASSFRLNDYLFANDKDGYPATTRRGAVFTFSGTRFPMRPEFTVAVGAAQNNGGPTAPLQGTYFGIRAALRPLDDFSLGLSYGANRGNRAALGLDASLGLGPVRLSALWDSSRVWGSAVGNWFDPALSDWAYYVKGDLALGPVSLSANYRAVDPQYEDGVAGMSSDHHHFHGGVGGVGDAPFAADNKGFGVEAKVSLDLLGGLEVRGYYDDSTDYASDPASRQVAWGVGATLRLFGALALNPFYNSLTVGGNVQPGSAGLGAYGNYNHYAHNAPDGRYSTSFGIRLTHDAGARDALVPGLAVTLGYQRFDDGSGTYPFEDLLASASYRGKLGFLGLEPYVRYHRFNDALVGTAGTRSAAFTGYNGTNTYSYTTLKFGVKLTTDPLDLPLRPSLEGVYAQRATAGIVQRDNVGGSDTPLPNATERYFRVALALNEFLVPKATLRIGYASYRGRNVVDPAGGFLTRGHGDYSLSADADQLFAYPGEVRFPWNLTTGAGTGSGGVDGIYLEAGYHNFSVAYLRAILLDGAGAVQSRGWSFKVRYKVGF
jgi:predicted  nucleic acid-binding Zn-ribbon protein